MQLIFPVCEEQLSRLEQIRDGARKMEMEALKGENKDEVDLVLAKLEKDLPDSTVHVEKVNPNPIDQVKEEEPTTEVKENDEESIARIERELQYFPDSYEECEENYAQQYLNRADVQKAVHALPPKIGNYKTCSDAVTQFYSYSSRTANMIPIFESLMGKGLKITIFSGDDDIVCATASLQHWIWKYNVATPWAQWKIKEDDGSEQLGGYHVGIAMQKSGKVDLHVYTVHGAGHMVPSTRPRAAFDLLKRYLSE